MSDYTFNNKYITKSADFILELIITKLKENNFFIGIGHGKKYNIIRVSSETIYYTGNQKNQGEPEVMDIADLKIAIEGIKKLSVFNTNSDLLKEKIPNSLYRKRTPLFGILSYTEIIIKVANE